MARACVAIRRRKNNRGSAKVICQALPLRRRHTVRSSSRFFAAIAASVHFNLSAAFAIPAFAHDASLSPPGAPLTATAPIVMSLTLIGTPPWALIVPGMVAGGAAVPAAGGVAGPEGRLYSIVAVAFILATSVVDAVAPSSRIIAFGALRPSTTS